MSKFKNKKGNALPAISTASLPDIIFMLLFFFMVVTTMKDASLKVNVSVPDATQLQKLEKKSLVSYIYVGRPKAGFEQIGGTAPRLQLGDKFADPEEIALFLEKEKVKIPEAQHSLITASLRVDRGVTMGIVGDVKTALRKANQLKINYSARPRVKDL